MEELKTKKNRWQWLYIFGGIFLVNAIILLTLVVIAEKNKPQLVEKNYYQAGKISHYKQRYDNNRKSGWIPTLSFHKQNDTLFLKILVVDPTKTKVSGIQGQVTLYRPSNQYLDRPNLKIEETADSTYRVLLKPKIQSGFWNAILTLKKDSLEYHERIPIMYED